MTRQEAAIVTMYTGFLIGSFSDAHEYAEKLMDRPIYTHEFANDKIVSEIKDLAECDFIHIVVTDGGAKHD